MIKPLFLCLALAELPAVGGQPGGSLAPIALYTQFQPEPPLAVSESMQAEVQLIMAPMGMSFQWRELSRSDGRQVSVELAVVNFKGRCDLAGLTPRDTSPGPLGWTHISDGVILPFADVDCDAVRSFLQKELLWLPPEERAPAFGRALGRVLAHELYHIFANTTHHGSEGVGRSFYSAQDLLAPEFQFESRESALLKNSKTHAALSAAGVPDEIEP